MSVLRAIVERAYIALLVIGGFLLLALCAAVDPEPEGDGDPYS